MEIILFQPLDIVMNREDKMELEFVKMEGLGNDFIILDDRKEIIEKHENYPSLAKRLDSRHQFGPQQQYIYWLRLLRPHQQVEEHHSFHIHHLSHK